MHGVRLPEVRNEIENLTTEVAGFEIFKKDSFKKFDDVEACLKKKLGTEKFELSLNDLCGEMDMLAKQKQDDEMHRVRCL
jgi:hypothetical protein